MRQCKNKIISNLISDQRYIFQNIMDLLILKECQPISGYLIHIG